MADERKRFIIETIYDSEGLKAFVQDVQTAQAVSQKFGIDLSKNASLLDQTISKSFTKSGKELTRISSIFEDNGKKIKVVFDRLQGVSDPKAVSASFVNFSNDLARLNTQLLSASKPAINLGERLTNLGVINRGFSRTFGDEFKKATLILDQLPAKLSQKVVTIDGKKFALPIQEFSTVVATADGRLQKLIQTATTLPSGKTNVTRQITDITDSFKSLRESADVTPDKTIRSFSQELSKLALNTNDLEKAGRFFTSGLSQQAKLVDLSSKNFNVNGQEVLRTTAIFNDSGKTIKTIFESTKDSTQKVSQQFQNAGDSVKSLGQNLKDLVVRAGLVIPVWLLLRSVFTGVLETFKASLKFMIDWEFQLAQIRIVSNNSASEIDKQHVAGVRRTVPPGGHARTL